MLQEILYQLKQGNDIFLVGFSGAGKTWYVKNVLIPFLQEFYPNIQYFEDCDALTDSVPLGPSIIDEVEIFEDQDFLENLHPEEKPYYPDFYIAKANKWYAALKNLKSPNIYIITRNETEAIENIEKTIKITPWNKNPAYVVRYNSQK